MTSPVPSSEQRVGTIRSQDCPHTDAMPIGPPEGYHYFCLDCGRQFYEQPTVRRKRRPAGDGQ